VLRGGGEGESARTILLGALLPPAGRWRWSCRLASP